MKTSIHRALLLAVLIALGLGQLLTRFPVLEVVLKILCGGALLYLTWGLVKPAFAPAPLVVQHKTNDAPV